MRELNKNELFSINGGTVPTSFYMDGDVMKANGRVFNAVGSFLAGFFIGLFD